MEEDTEINDNQVDSNESSIEDHIQETQSFRKIHNISFSGGGLKAIVFLGCVKALQEYNMLTDVRAISGSSAGALVATLLACKCDYKKISEYMHGLMDMYSTYQMSFFKLIRKMRSKTYGVYDTNDLKEYIRNIINASTETNTDITFLELYKISNIKLIITATCLDDKTIFYFNHETTPDTSVSEACMISCNIPFMFERKVFMEKNMTDGCITELLPMQCWSDSEMHNTLAFLIVKNKKKKEYNTIRDYMDDLMSSNFAYQIEDYKKRYFDSLCIVSPPQSIGTFPTPGTFPSREEMSAIIYSSFFQTLSTLESKGYKEKNLIPANYIYENDISIQHEEASEWPISHVSFVIFIILMIYLYKIYRRR